MNEGRDELDRYLDALPHGLDSYPECQMKGSVVRIIVSRLPASSIGELPRPLARWIEAPPLPTEWVSEVHATALVVYAARVVYGSDEALVQRAYEDNYALLDSLTYRILFRFVGAQRLLPQTAARWSMFHRGTELTVIEQRDPRRGATVRLRTPPKHVPSVMARVYGVGFKAALEIAGGRNVQMDVLPVDVNTIDFRGRWE